MSLFFFALGCASAFACGYFGADAHFFHDNRYVPLLPDRKTAVAATVVSTVVAAISAVIFIALR